MLVARVSLILVCLVSTSHAKRRKHFLPGDVIAAPYGMGGDYGGRLLLGFAAQAGEHLNAGPQLHLFMVDRVSVGARVRLAHETAYEAELAVSLGRVAPEVAGLRARIDLMLAGGVGTTAQSFGTLSLRVQPRRFSRLENALTFELGVRATESAGPRPAFQVGMMVGVMWPAMTRTRTCTTGTYWN